MSNRQNPKYEQNQEEHPLSVLQKALITGFVGGIFWGGLGSLAYFFNFTSVSHSSFILRSFIMAPWTEGLLGELISLFLLGLISMGASYLYFILFRRARGMFPGIFYGLGLWLLVMFFLNPVFTAVPAAVDLDSVTVTTTVCQYVLYGAFIGYSISYEYHKEDDSKVDSGNGQQKEERI
ncbi:membrane protein YqhR [Melghiribacillus thermohalophilus]|uniref:Membrane protein YqhR n=1 Tax=Melghiribacillus thermohalophilus TaxID=1324956 RepID=A0A4R3NBB7_9BACI|nr:YqhR family membrane protein [Melghiribacillus thermohalophilus]TCT26939.1 membrane protein YqhR [Melghiribacillus thermohalophilus]